MNISSFSIHRPIFTVMLMLAIVAVGLVAVSRLPIDLMPDITFPTLSISTTYENTGPEEIEQIITRPIEEAMSAVPGVEEVFSVSSEGSSNVRVMFAWGTDLDAAADDMRERLDRIIPRLPDDVDRPMLRKFDPAMFPILIVGALSNLDPIQTRRIIDEQIVLSPRARARRGLGRHLGRPRARDPGQSRRGQGQGAGPAARSRDHRHPRGQRRPAGRGHRTRQLRDPGAYPRRVHQPAGDPRDGRGRASTACPCA